MGRATKERYAESSKSTSGNQETGADGNEQNKGSHPRKIDSTTYNEGQSERKADRKDERTSIKYCGGVIPQPNEVTNRESRISSQKGKSEAQATGEGVEFRLGRRPLRIISIKFNDSPTTPTARIVSPELKTKTSLLLDSGSEINIIKKPALRDSAIIDDKESIEVRGITATSLVSLGQTVIQVAGHPVIFHVVDDSLLIDQDGIQGSEFFAGCKARLDYEEKTYQMGKYLYSLRY